MNSCRRLTTDGSLKFTPRYVQGGREIVYVSFADPKLMRMMRLVVGERGSTPVFPAAAKSEFEPAFSRDGRYLAFVQLRGVLSLALVIHDHEGKDRGEVPPASGFAGMRSPAIAPDHSRVTYSFAEGPHQKLWSVNTKGGERKQLTDGVGMDNWPSYSPDGKHVVFASSRQGVFDLYVMNADGTGVRPLTRGRHRCVRPEFSPDGERIAYGGFHDGAMRVFVMTADGREGRRVVTGSDGDDYPSWHPDGKRLVVVSQRDGQCDLVEVEV